MSTRTSDRRRRPCGTWRKPEECLLREVKEETGYTLTSWRFRGLVTFVTEAENSKTVEYMEYMCLYTADGFTGEPTACDEANSPG